MNKTRQPMIALAVLTAALAMPMAFAQTAEPTDGMQEATTEATPADPTAQTAPEAAAQLTWNDVDTDKDGAISREESVQLASLAQVFDEADADKDGLLTAEEYRAYAATATDEAGADSSGGID